MRQRTAGFLLYGRKQSGPKQVVSYEKSVLKATSARGVAAPASDVMRADSSLVFSRREKTRLSKSMDGLTHSSRCDEFVADTLLGCEGAPAVCRRRKKAMDGRFSTEAHAKREISRPGACGVPSHTRSVSTLAVGWCDCRRSRWLVEFHLRGAGSCPWQLQP